MTKEHIVAQIAYSIVNYENVRDKLSLLQDLIITTLPHVERGDTHWHDLMSARCNQRVDDICIWLNGFMKAYLAIPQVSAALPHRILTQDDDDTCECVYYQGGGLYSLVGRITPIIKVKDETMPPKLVHCDSCWMNTSCQDIGTSSSRYTTCSDSSSLTVRNTDNTFSGYL